MVEPGPAVSIAESSAPAAEFLVEPGPAIAESSAPAAEFLVEPGPAAESSAPVAPSDPNAVAAAAVAERSDVAGDSPGPGHADVNVLSPSKRKWIWKSPQKRNAAASSSSARPADSFNVNQPPGPAEIVPRLPISVCFLNEFILD